MPLSRLRNATLSRPPSLNLLQVTHELRRGSGDSRNMLRFQVIAFILRPRVISSKYAINSDCPSHEDGNL